MSKLPPVEKLPLAIRKSCKLSPLHLRTSDANTNRTAAVRDDWDAKKGDIESKLSEILGVAWTINVNPHQIYAYSDSSAYAKENLGSCLHE